MNWMTFICERWISEYGAPVELYQQGKPNHSVNVLSHSHFVDHESNTDWPGIETRPPRWEAGHDTAEKKNIRWILQRGNLSRKSWLPTSHFIALFLSDLLSYRDIILCDKFHLSFPVVSFVLLPQPSQTASPHERRSNGGKVPNDSCLIK
jgi:hypothetical protein